MLSERKTQRMNQKVIKIKNMRVVKMTEEKDPVFTSFHGHTKFTIIYRETIYEKYQKTGRKYLKLKIKRGKHNEMCRKGRDVL